MRPCLDTPEDCVRGMYEHHSHGAPNTTVVQTILEGYRTSCRTQRYGAEGMSDSELDTQCWREVVQYSARVSRFDNRMLDVYSEIDDDFDFKEAYLNYHGEPFVPWGEYMGEVTRESRFVSIPDSFTPQDVADALDTVRRGANTIIVGPDNRIYHIVDVGERGVELYRLDEVK